MSPVRLAYLVTHPIQYQAPLLRAVAAREGIALTVFFASDHSLGAFHDPEFATQVEWDVPLLAGYTHHFLPTWGDSRRLSTFRPFNHGFLPLLAQGGFDALWVHGYGRPLHLYAIWQAARLGLPVLLRDEATHISRERGPWKTMAKRRFFAWLARQVRCFLAIGQLNRDYYLDNGIPRERIVLMPYAVDNAYFAQRAQAAAPGREALRRELGLHPKRQVVLLVAKLIDRKDPLRVLEALARWPGGELPHLLVAGEGPLRARMEQAAALLPAGTVHFLGFVPPSGLPRLYDLADVLVLPSREEAWGLVVNEAMACGCPVVVSDRVGCGPDLVRPGETGAVFPQGQAQALAESLAMVLSASMGEAAKHRVDQWGIAESVAGLVQGLARCGITKHGEAATF